MASYGDISPFQGPNSGSSRKPRLNAYNAAIAAGADRATALEIAKLAGEEAMIQRRQILPDHQSGLPAYSKEPVQAHGRDGIKAARKESYYERLIGKMRGLSGRTEESGSEAETKGEEAPAYEEHELKEQKEEKVNDER